MNASTLTPSFSTIADAVRHWAQAKPDAPALKAPGAEDLSYAGLKQQLDSTSEQLVSLGYGADHRLVLVLPQGILLASCLLTLSAACAVYPIDDSLTVPELVKAFKKADVSVVLMTPSGSVAARTAAAELGIPVIELVTPEGKPSGRYDLRGVPAAVPSSTVMQPDTTAFLISTSGTTGTSKLVPISHRMFADVAVLKSKMMGLTQQDVTIISNPVRLISPLSTALYTVIYYGGCPIIDTPYDTSKYLEHVEQYQPNWIDISPPFLKLIHAHLSKHPIPPAMKRLRFIRSGGAAVPVELMETLEHWLGVPVLHGYGLTETLAENVCNPLPPATRKHETVGVLLHGEIAVFSEDGVQLSSGEVGELGLRSPLIFKGYFNPEDNIPSPFRDGWFMTGDLARIDEEGYVTIVGRLKEMINSGAMKILPGEVESAIRLHPEAVEACVVPLPHPTMGEQVTAAVVRRTENLTETVLLDFLKQHLAVYKLPASIIFVDAIPHNPGGKMIRSQVISRIKHDLEHRTSVDDALLLGETGREIVKIWRNVLDQNVVKVDVSFLTAGGDSITAVRLAYLLSETFNISFKVTDVFDYPTILSQAAEIDRRRRSGG